MAVEIDLLNTKYGRKYQSLLYSSDKSLLYASLKYRDFLRKVLKNSHDYYLIAIQNGNITAALPCFLHENKQHGNVLNSMPFFGSNGGIIVSPQNNCRKKCIIALHSEFKNLAKKYNVVSSTIISNPIDLKKEYYDRFFDHDYTDTRIGQFTLLPQNQSNDADIQDSLMSIYHQKTRNSIRKASKSGIKLFHDGSWAVLETLAEMHQQNMERIGGTSKPLSVFKAIHDSFEYDKDYRVYVATKDDVLIAGLLVLFFNKTAEYFIPATKYGFREYQPMSLIIFEAMKKAVVRNFLYWNWGGTWTSQTGVYNFKKKWGTHDYPYYYYIRLYDDQILLKNSTTLNRHYPYFYIVPFDKLKT